MKLIIYTILVCYSLVCSGHPQASKSGPSGSAVATDRYIVTSALGVASNNNQLSITIIFDLETREVFTINSSYGGEKYSRVSLDDIPKNDSPKK